MARATKVPSSEDRGSGAAEVAARISALGGWREAALGRMRALILEAAPEAIEAVKWKKPSNAMSGVATWSRAGLICTGESYKDKVKLTFAKGAALPDPTGLFNASLGGGTRRAIDIGPSDAPDAEAFKALIRAAAKLNGG